MSTLAANSEAFASSLRSAEHRLRAAGLSGRSAYAALCRHLSARLGIPGKYWLDGPDAPDEARLDRIPLTAELDLFGLAYERFFPEVFKAERGQYFTPRPLVELMVDLADVRPGERVLDPTCGSGTFLAVALSRGAEVDGIEVDPELVALCRLNLALHGANPRAVRQADLFRDDIDETWDVILANPPFSVAIEHPDALRRFSVANGRARAQSDILFLQAAYDRLRPGGRLAAILPRSILANASYAWVRQWLGVRFVRRAVIALPEGVFRPFGGTTARAVIIVLEKHPAQVRPWTVGVVADPGYDTTRKQYRITEQDDIGALRIGWRQGTLPTASADSPEWVPDGMLCGSGIGPEVTTMDLGDVAPLASRQSFRPEDDPSSVFSEIDLADVDKQTGEVTAARVREGDGFTGSKTPFEDGDLLFARIRPKLNNVVVASRPHPDLPTSLCGSSEWIRMQPEREAYFALIAARSCFVRDQLQSTDGQTRPRIRAEDLPEIEIPDPGAENRVRMDRIVRKAHATRLEARRHLDTVAVLYEQFGRGEIDADALAIALDTLD